MGRRPRYAKSTRNSGKSNVDNDTAENILARAKVLARGEVKYLEKGIDALTLIVDDRVFIKTVNEAGETVKVPTFKVDQYLRVGVHPDALKFFTNMAKAVSPSNPCPVCGKTSHHELSYIGGALVHELWHPINKHYARVKEVNDVKFKVWNVATDCEINDDLLEIFKDSNTGICLPGGTVYPSSFDFKDGLVAETYYEMLMKLAQDRADKEGKSLDQVLEEMGMKDDCGSGATGVGEEWEPGEPDANNPGVESGELEVIEAQMAKDIEEAAKARGNVPGNYVRWANEKLGRSKYNWRQDINKRARYAAHMVRGEDQTTYRRLGRLTHVLDGEAVFPTYQKPVPNIAVVMDTSGSVSDQWLTDGMTEVDNIAKALGAPITVIDCDAGAGIAQEIVGGVHSVQLGGGGGTDMRVGIEAALALQKKPSIIIVFTDGETPWHEVTPDPSVSYIAALVGNRCGKWVTDAIPNYIYPVRITPEEDF